MSRLIAIYEQKVVRSSKATVTIYIYIHMRFRISNITWSRETLSRPRWINTAISSRSYCDDRKKFTTLGTAALSWPKYFCLIAPQTRSKRGEIHHHCIVLVLFGRFSLADLGHGIAHLFIFSTLLEPQSRFRDKFILIPSNLSSKTKCGSKIKTSRPVLMWTVS